jgi:hypothetical protein
MNIKNFSFKNIYQEYKFMILTGVVALLLSLGVFLFVKNEIDRFTFIMPIFASWILAAILFDLPDEEVEAKN